jgi:hypothetical protein
MIAKFLAGLVCGYLIGLHVTAYKQEQQLVGLVLISLVWFINIVKDVDKNKRQNPTDGRTHPKRD